MKRELLITVLMAMFLFIGFGCREIGEKQNSYLLHHKTLRIVVTDSGLGGLSVMQHLIDRIEESGYYVKAEVIFVNAVFDSLGYNALHSRGEKISRFNKVLEAIEERYDPDAIVVACNTLSVLIDDTEFIKKSNTPVVSIIEPGVNLIRSTIENDKSASVIIFGTETTIEEGNHIAALRDLKMPETKIISQACPQLQNYIEADPNSEETAMLIDYYLQEALAKLPNQSDNVYLSLNCTHYGYSENLWLEMFSNTKYRQGGVINPNKAMAELLIINAGEIRNDTELQLLVVSKVKLVNTEALQKFFGVTAPEISAALRNYSLIPDIF
jgi:glutamate racemase